MPLYERKLCSKVSCHDIVRLVCWLCIYEISGVAVRKEIAVLANCKPTKEKESGFILCCIIKNSSTMLHKLQI